MTFDHVLVGGGLHNGLVALGLLHHDPAARFALVEQGAIGGNHTWCHHAADVDPIAAPWVEPLVGWRWAGYDVAFPDRARGFDEPYAMIASSALRAAVEAAVEAAPNAALVRGEAVEVAAGRVRLADGAQVEGRVVIDGRGPARGVGDCGYQKFVGWEVELAAPHGLDRPVLMDARLPQIDGLRFMYVLPLDARRALIEDTYFADGPALDVAGVERELERYAAGRGWSIARVVRREQGVLPLPWAPAPPPPDDGVLRAGYRGGFFHPVTGYSLPMATRLSALAATSSVEALPARWAEYGREVRGRQRFCHLLNRAMFRHCAPEARWQLMSRFHRRPAALIRRFYALRMTRWDRFVAVAGPIPRCLQWRPRPPAALEERAA
ncbi:MAG: lycopene beta-cyclase CrtY [bacterium]